MSELPEYNPNETRMPNAHEELLGMLIAYPHLFTEHKHRLEAMLFYENDWIYRLLYKTEREDGALTFKGITNRCASPQMIDAVREIRSIAFTDSPKYFETQYKRASGELLKDRLKGMAHGILSDVETSNADETMRKVHKHIEDMTTVGASAMANPEKDAEDTLAYLVSVAADPSKAYGMMTGITDIDLMTNGFQRGDFSVVGARTSIGKSAFMADLLLRLESKGHKVALFSLEMTKRQVHLRMLGNKMGISGEALRLGKAMPETYSEKIHAYRSVLANIYIDDTRGIDADYIGDVMGRLKRTAGLDFVVVDYIQDVKEQGESNDNSGSAISRVCRKLRKAAQECDCHVMGLSQVVRGVEDRSDKRPGSADLSGSTGIETSADVIMLLYRDDYYNPRKDSKPSVLEVNFSKHRNGRVGRIELRYDLTTQRITGPRGDF